MSKVSPLVCICVPTYNAAKTVHHTLTSILNQTYENIVVHVSDNASTDDTLKIIDSLDDTRIRVNRFSVNVGGEANFTRCIQLACGKYTVIFHADDIYESDIIEKQVNFLEAHKHIGAVFTHAAIIDKNGVMNGRFIEVPKSEVSVNHVYDFNHLFKAILMHSNFLVCPSVMVRTNIYQEVIGTWNGTDFGTSADLDVWFRLALNTLVGIIPEPLMRYRISKSQHTEKLRSRTTRSDFFLVIDYYLSKKSVQNFLSKNDYLNYSRLERTDRTVRAANLYLLGKQKEAAFLCTDAFTLDTFYAATKNKRGLFTLVAGVVIRFLVFVDLPILGQRLIRHLKNFIGK